MNYYLGASGGKDSTCLALAMKERHPELDVSYLITPTGNEGPEMIAHWQKLECLLGKPLIRLQPFGEGVDGLRHLIEAYLALPSWKMRWCTRQLKIEPTIAYLTANAPCIQYVGLRADEDVDERRGIYGEMPGVEQRFPLREWGWGLEEVIDFLAERAIRIPKRTDCLFCYGQRIIEWKRLWEEHPDIYEQGVQLEKLTGHTFRSARRDTWPASMEGMREEFEKGRKVKGEKKPGTIQLNLWDAVDEEQQSCRVCRM